MAHVSIQQKPISNGKKSLRLDYYKNGQRIIETLGIHVTPADKKSSDQTKRRAYEESWVKAEYLRMRKEQQLITGEHDIPMRKESKSSFIEYFDKMATTRSPTWHSVGNHLKRFIKGNLTFGNITEEWITRFQAHLQSRVSNAAVHTYMGIITACLNQAVRDKLLPNNPSRNVPKVHGEEVDPRYLTKDDLSKLLDASDKLPVWFRDAFMFSCYTGLRISDVETLTWGEIALGSNNEGKASRTIIKRQVKTHEFVRVPVSPQAEAILLGQWQSDQAPSKQDRVFQLKSRTTVKRLIDRWRKETGIYFTFHSSRHTFGTMLQSAGVDINTTSKLMGHKGLAMTLRYAKVIDQVREDAITKLDRFLQ